MYHNIVFLTSLATSLNFSIFRKMLKVCHLSADGFRLSVQKSFRIKEKKLLYVKRARQVPFLPRLNCPRRIFCDTICHLDTICHSSNKSWKHRFTICQPGKDDKSCRYCTFFVELEYQYLCVCVCVCLTTYYLPLPLAS